MIKLIATDLDGTLLDSQKRLPPGFFEQVRKMRTVQFVAASGRQYHSLLKIFASVLKEMILIAENGALIWSGGKIIHMEPLEPEDAYFMLQKAKNTKRAYPILCTQDCAYIEEGPKQMMDQAFAAYDHCCVVGDLLEMAASRCICKIAVHSLDNQAEADVYPALRRETGNFTVILSGTASVDIMRRGVNKGKALELLQQRLEIRPDECAAFGDYLNDYELLQAVGESYAMENGHCGLKTAARYVAPSNDSYGVMKVLHEIERRNRSDEDIIIPGKIYSGR